ncbi:MAG: Holliday junction branch migration protein RuvA, partial [Pseudomonadota bacterium]
AQRVVNELKDKAPQVMAMANTASQTAPLASRMDEVIDVVESAAPVSISAPNSSPNTQAEALSALTNLGYAPGEAAGAVAQAAGDAPDAETSDLIRRALRLLAPAG